MSWRSRRVALDSAQFVVTGSNFNGDGELTSSGLQASFVDYSAAEECHQHYQALAGRHGGVAAPQLLSIRQFWGQEGSSLSP